MPGKPSSIIKLSAAQKDEVRKLTQMANRRISAAMKQYEKEGLTQAPYDVTGGIQERSQWHSDKYAIGRSIKFASEKAYKEHLKFLKEFQNPKVRPTITEYSKIQQDKIALAIETLTGGEITDKLLKKISKLNSAQLSKFWKDFSDVASKLGLEYDSEALLAFAAEYFKEDIDQLVNYGEDGE